MFCSNADVNPIECSLGVFSLFILRLFIAVVHLTCTTCTSYMYSLYILYVRFLLLILYVLKHSLSRTQMTIQME